MDTNNVAVEGQDTQSGNALGEGQQITSEQFEELQQELAKSKANTERILKESQRNRESYLSMKQEKESAERAKLEATGDKEAMLEAERQRAAKLESDWKAEKNKRISQSLKFHVAKNATDAHNADDVITNLSNEGIEYDESTDSFTGLSEAIEKIRQSKTYLFKTEPANSVNQMPSNMSMGTESTFEKELDGAKTQLEYDAVLRKYGRL